MSTKLIPLSPLGLLKVSGTDAVPFLQGMLTSDIRQLTPGGHQLSAFCNRQGRVLSLMDIFRMGDDYFLIIPLDLIHEIHQTLQKYIVFSKAHIDNVSDDYAGVAVLAEPPSPLPDAIAFRSTPSATALQLWGEKAVIAAYCQSYPLGHWQDFLKAQTSDHIPFISAKDTGQFLPHPLGLIALGVVNFKKGCYIGQEIIARMEYRSAKIKNKTLPDQ